MYTTVLTTTLLILFSIWWAVWIALAFGTKKNSVGVFLLLIGLAWFFSSWQLLASGAFCTADCSIIYYPAWCESLPNTSEECSFALES